MEFLCIAIAHFLALLSPGPDFFLIMQASLRLPVRYGIAICLGIGCANGLYLALAVVGLEMVRELSWLSIILKYCGGGYLVFVGVMLLKAPSRTVSTKEPAGFLHLQHLGRQFLIGFTSAILNPKNVIFYFALFTGMVSEQTSFLIRCCYGLWMTLMVIVWDCGLVVFLHHWDMKTRLGRGIFYVEKCSGAALLFFGLVLPFA